MSEAERSALVAARRVDAEDARTTSTEQQRAFENRIRAIATNAVLASMACYDRTVMTDDDAARVDAIEKILILPRTSGRLAYPVVVPVEQTAPPAASAALQAAIEGAAKPRLITGGEAPAGDQNEA